MTDFAALKRQVRQAVHDFFAVPALYTDAANPAPGIGVHVRWHNRLIRQGNLSAAGYAEVFEGVNRLLFGRVELDARTVDPAGQTWGGFTPMQGGVVTIAAYGGAVFTLDTREPTEGPVDVIWNVAKEGV